MQCRWGIPHGEFTLIYSQTLPQLMQLTFLTAIIRLSLALRLKGLQIGL